VHTTLSILGESQIAVDLGCGEGSFNYYSYPCKIIGIDVNLSGKVLRQDQDRLQYIEADASLIPLKNGSIDAVICNNTLEHFVDYRKALSEIQQILNRAGLLWVAIADGHGLSDILYRWLVFVTSSPRSPPVLFQPMLEWRCRE
jgi:ubiquinone/menaquinone biosynthesis C-methylase UbiE